MSTINVAIDNIRTYSQDLADLNKFCEALRKDGHTVTAVGVGPNKIQGYMRSKSHSCDIMIQIAGGLCIGTLGDFITGLKRPYYYAKKGAIIYDMVANNLNAKTWKAVRAKDWYYSMSTVTPYLGKTLPQVYSENKDVLVGFADGETIDELISNFRKCMGGNGNSTGEGEGAGGGSSALDLIKQVCSDWDPLGPEILLNGDTVTVKRTNPKEAVGLSTDRIQLNTVTFQDYDSDTPNSFGGVKDDYLIKRFGEVPLDLEVTDSNKAQILQVNQRGHNHVIELKALLSKDFIASNWVNLTLPELGISNRPYYISKTGYSEERLIQLTLESAPPSIYVDVQEVSEEEEEETSEEETSEEEDT